MSACNVQGYDRLVSTSHCRSALVIWNEMFATIWKHLHLNLVSAMLELMLCVQCDRMHRGDQCLANQFLYVILVHLLMMDTAIINASAVSVVRWIQCFS